ncbi:hypothetical protein AWB67_05240 [Caballeronia terrestris]|jgi:hypothetical protein|uniref:Lipoprotein n=1 Tax=Caballeronia terrestris TaxID=1226301 RepID=A0A158KCM9_9BURK|nr:hypothetical protein [Caballeronia terrestris]SAL78300.1 hypothetical protein AWB67_05240 [Caballeronia terrestris]
MKQRLLNLATALATTSAAIAAVVPATSYGHALDRPLDCKSSAHTFIAPLVNARYIETTPMRVESNSVNAFRPTHGSDLTAFGFRVYAVLGYERDDAMFKKGSGQPLTDSAYGVVVTGPAEQVEERVRASGSDAVVHSVVPLVLTAVFCGKG